MLQEVTWLLDLSALGYIDPLPAPSIGVQATIASIVSPEIHELVQTTNNAALIDKDDDGDHALSCQCCICYTGQLYYTC
jgi:hypothetical protein